MLGRRLTPWANIKTALVQCVVFAWSLLRKPLTQSDSKRVMYFSFPAQANSTNFLHQK